MNDTTEDVVIVGDEPYLAKPTGFRLGGDFITTLNVVFLATTIVGVVAEYSGSVVVAVSAMLAFLAYGLFFRKEVPNIERFGDSAYYQGFILTLFALLFGLTGKGSHSITSDEVIQKFGLAIWTTCIGMTGRILIIQFLATVRDQDEEARESITEYIANLNKEMEGTLAQIGQFRSSVVNSTSKIATELADESRKSRKEATDSVKAAMGTLTRSVEQSSKKLDDSVDLIASRISKLDIPTDLFSERIRRVADVLEADLNKLRAGLEQGASRFAETLHGNVAILESTRADLSLLQRTLGEVNGLILSASREASASLDSTQASLTASTQAARGVEQLGEMASRLAQHLGRLENQFEKRAQSYGDQFELASKEMREIVTTTRRDADAVTLAMAESAKKITTAIQEAGRANEPN